MQHWIGRGRPRNIWTILVVFLCYSMTILPVLTSPITSSIVVLLSRNEATTYTAGKISDLLEDTIIVGTQSVWDNLLLIRSAGEVIYVGHGTKQGIRIGANLVDWGKFAREAHYVPAKTYVAACYSERAAEVGGTSGSSRVFFGFRGFVDVDEAAYTTVARIAAARGNVGRARGLLQELTMTMIGKILEPEKHKLWLLAAHDVRDIWWVYWKEYQSYELYVEYTHPNTYSSVDASHYYDIGVQEDVILEGNNFIAHHIPKDTLSLISSGIAVGGALLTFAAALAAYLGWIPEPVSKLADLLIAFIGVILVAMGLTADELFADESDSGWEYAKDTLVIFLLGVPIYVQWDYKIGKSWWCRIVWATAYWTWFPLWYCDRNLGLGGI